MSYAYIDGFSTPNTYPNHNEVTTEIYLKVTL